MNPSDAHKGIIQGDNLWSLLLMVAHARPFLLSGTGGRR